MGGDWHVTIPTLEWPPERIAEVLEYEAKATPGPWEYIHVEECLIKPHVQQVKPNGARYTIATPVHSNEETASNMRFIAQARTDLPSAVREIQRMQNRLKFARDAFLNIVAHLVGSIDPADLSIKQVAELAIAIIDTAQDHVMGFKICIHLGNAGKGAIECGVSAQREYHGLWCNWSWNVKDVTCKKCLSIYKKRYSKESDK